jgi:hypothetical protein
MDRTLRPAGRQALDHLELDRLAMAELAILDNAAHVGERHTRRLPARCFQYGNEPTRPAVGWAR